MPRTSVIGNPVTSWCQSATEWSHMTIASRLKNVTVATVAGTSEIGSTKDKVAGTESLQLLVIVDVVQKVQEPLPEHRGLYIQALFCCTRDCCCTSMYSVLGNMISSMSMSEFMKIHGIRYRRRACAES